MQEHNVPEVNEESSDMAGAEFVVLTGQIGLKSMERLGEELRKMAVELWKRPGRVGKNGGRSWKTAVESWQPKQW